MNEFQTIILAGGKGTRMKSKKPKVLHDILGKTLIQYIIDSVKLSNPDKIIIVVGDKREEVEKSIKEDVTFCFQNEQLGTAHAIMICDDLIDEDKNILVLCGDTPAIKSETIKKFIDFHNNNENDLSLISTIVKDSTGYGRIVRNNKKIIKIVEHNDATEEELNINEINTGIYCFKGKVLKESLKMINNNNAKNEYYLTDTLEIIINKGLKAEAMIVNDNNEFLGINNKLQLANLTKYISKNINETHMLNGVEIINPDTTYIGPDIKIGVNTIIKPNTTILGQTVIGDDCIIGDNSNLIDMEIGNNVEIKASYCMSSKINNNSKVGPFAYIRPNSEIGQNTKIGNFVEIKNTKIGDNTKASHLTYLGDAVLGENINIGCGVITANYDGKNKNVTTIENNVFVGSNSNLIAPVTIEKNSFIAAGTTVTKKVEQNSLVIGRVRQENISNYEKNKK